MVGDKETSMLSAIVYLSVGLARTVIRNSKVTQGQIVSLVLKLNVSTYYSSTTVETFLSYFGFGFFREFER